jgi:hypothetical protein
MLVAVGMAVGAVDAPMTLGRTGQDLLRWLEETSVEPNHVLLRGAANGFVDGVASTLQLLKIICPPPGTSRGQNAAIVVKYLKDNPKEWQLDSTFLSMTALQDAWACQKP